jgi:prolipoprotein diacylglyceryltransferase
MNVELGTALTGIVGGALVIAFRKFSVRTFIESRRDPSKALPAELQEKYTLAFGLLMMCVGVVALVIWLV